MLFFSTGGRSPPSAHSLHQTLSSLTCPSLGEHAACYGSAEAMERFAAAASGTQARAAWLQLLQQLLQAPSLQAVLLAGLAQPLADSPKGASGRKGTGHQQGAGKDPSASHGASGASRDDTQDEDGEGAAARLASSASESI